MKNIIKLILTVLIIYGCSSDDNNSNNDNDNGGGLIPQAIYRITFTGEFTSTTHPTDYPDNPSFEMPFLMAHGNSSTLFRVGQIASPGMEAYAEEGETITLQNEHIQGEDDVAPTTIIIGSTIGATDTFTTEITITPDKTLLSFVSKISPSPDWFVGVDSFNLMASGNTLVEQMTIELFAKDAGTDGGTTYTSDDLEESMVVSNITGPPFVDDGGPVNINNKLGTLKIERIDN